MKHCFCFEFLSALYVCTSNSEKGTSAFNVAWGDFVDFPFNWSLNVKLLQQVVNMTHDPNMSTFFRCLSSSQPNHCEAMIPLSVHFFYCISEMKSRLESQCLFSTNLQKNGADGALDFLFSNCLTKNNLIILNYKFHLSDVNYRINTKNILVPVV